MNENPFSLPDDGWFNIAAPGEWPHKPTGLVQVLDDEAMAEIVKAFVEFKAAPNWPGILIDFDHQSLDIDKPTVAAGWIVDLAKRDNGLWAQVRWSDIGRKSIEGGRYRFISPVWKSSDCAKLDGDRIRPLKLMNCAVTNDPNIKGLFPLSNSAGAAAEFSPPPMPIRPEPPQAPSSPPAIPEPSRIGMDAALFTRALHSRSPLAIGNRAPLSRRQEIAIILKYKNGPGGQVSIGPGKIDSKANPAPEIAAGKNEVAAGGTAQRTPEQQAFLLAAVERAKKAVYVSEVGRAKTTNETLRAMRANLGKKVSPKISNPKNTPPPVENNTAVQPNEKSDAARWKKLGFGQDESGKWKSEWQLKWEGYSLQADGNWKKVPAVAVKTAEINPATTAYVPGLQAGRYGELQYRNRARRGGILANYAGQNYDEDQRRAIFAWYAGGGSRSTGRDTAGRIANLQSQIDELEASRPARPDNPADFSLIDVSEVKRQAMAEGVDSGEVLSRIADAKSTNAERKRAWSALKRKIRKQYKNKSARERAISRELDRIQKAYAGEMEDWTKANAKIDGKISELRAKIAEEEVRGGEATAKAAFKDADKAQAELKSVEKEKTRDAVKAQVEAEKKAWKAAHPTQTKTPQELALSDVRIKDRAVNLVVGKLMTGNYDDAMRIFPTIDREKVEATMAEMAAEALNHPGQEKKFATKMSEALATYLNGLYVLPDRTPPA
jgi:hypothetical protein